MDNEQLAPAAQAAADDDNVKEMPESADTGADKPRNAWSGLVVLAVVVTAVAWVAMVYSGMVSFCLSLAGLAASVAGAILVGKGAWRSLGITSAIAAGVLALVYTLLWAALRIIVG